MTAADQNPSFMKVTTMTTIPTQGAFEQARLVHPQINNAPTNAVLPTPEALAQHLAKVQPELAKPPTLVAETGTPLATMEWPQHAIAQFNREVVNQRAANIGTALTTAVKAETPVLATLMKAHLYALLVLNQTQPLGGAARETAHSLHRATCEQRDHTPLDHWLDMKPHAFGKTARRYGDAIVRWAERGVEPDEIPEVTAR
jgi:hypothetical protein